jgi:hypothetical protein
VADGGDEVALAASFDTQNTEAVLGVVDATRSTSPTPFEVLVFSAPGIKSWWRLRCCEAVGITLATIPWVRIGSSHDGAFF